MEERFARENPDASKGGGGNAILSQQSRDGAAWRWGGRGGGQGSVRAGVWRETPFSASPPHPAPSHWDKLGRGASFSAGGWRGRWGWRGEGSGTRPEGWSPGHSGRFNPSCRANPGPGSPTEAADEPVQKQRAQVPSSKAMLTVSSGDQGGCAT